jgi:branched-chain amino acid transport system substrate-binding protein
LEEHAKRMGYEFLKLPVTSPGLEQKATWLQVRQQRPDYVLLWGWGVMNSTALKEAVAVNYPRSKMYGVWWSAAEPDVLPADSGAAGFNGLTLQQANETNNPVHRDVLKYVYEKGQGTGRREEIGTVLYNRGLQAAMLIVESIRRAQSKYGKRAVSGEEVRWGAENLNLDAARIKTMGFEGMMQPLKTSCSDHVGTTGARIHTWDGKTWRYSTDWYQADAAFLRPIIEASAQKYAEERKVRARDCSK